MMPALQLSPAYRKTSNKATDNYGNTVGTCKHYYITGADAGRFLHRSG